MCLLVFYINPSASADEYYLILVNVRDEFYNRPTKLADFWKDHPDVIGSIDIEPGKEGGSWIVTSRKGKIGALLNVLQPDNEILPNQKGRGFLAVDYVTGEKDCLSYLNDINLEKGSYNGFLLVTMNFRPLKSPEIAYVTNASASPPTVLGPGIHAFGNSMTPQTPWPKVTNAKEKFTNVIKKHSSISTKAVLAEELFSMLNDRTCYSLDESMRKQGISKPAEYMDKLSSIFVYIPEANYGSRCHTVIIIDGSGNVDYFERSRNEELPPEVHEKWLSLHHSFKLST